jgi:hypothetical protein
MTFTLTAAPYNPYDQFIVGSTLTLLGQDTAGKNHGRDRGSSRTHKEFPAAY